MRAKRSRRFDCLRSFIATQHHLRTSPRHPIKAHAVLKELSSLHLTMALTYATQQNFFVNPTGEKFVNNDGPTSRAIVGLTGRKIYSLYVLVRACHMAGMGAPSYQEKRIPLRYGQAPLLTRARYARAQHTYFVARDLGTMHVSCHISRLSYYPRQYRSEPRQPNLK